MSKYNQTVAYVSAWSWCSYDMAALDYAVERSHRETVKALRQALELQVLVPAGILSILIIPCFIVGSAK